MKETEKPAADYRLPKSVLRWVGVGLVPGTAVVAIITIFSGVTLSDLARLGYLTFALAAAVTACRPRADYDQFLHATTTIPNARVQLVSNEAVYTASQATNARTSPSMAAE